MTTSFSPRHAADLSDIARGVITRFGTVLSRRDITVRLWVELDCGPARVDRSDIRRLCENLLLRAIRVTPEQGTVYVRVSCDERDVFLAISDEGAGYHPRQVGQLAPLLQTCRSLGEANDGKLRWATSEGFGTTFTLRVPRA